MRGLAKIQAIFPARNAPRRPKMDIEKSIKKRHATKELNTALPTYAAYSWNVHVSNHKHCFCHLHGQGGCRAVLGDRQLGSCSVPVWTRCESPGQLESICNRILCCSLHAFSPGFSSQLDGHLVRPNLSGGSAATST